MPSGSSSLVELTMDTLRTVPYRSNTAHTFWKHNTQKVRDQHKTSTQEPTPRTQGSSEVYLGNASGCRPHILSIHQDVHCVIGSSTNAHMATHLDPRWDKDKWSAHISLTLHSQPLTSYFRVRCFTPSLSKFRP